MSDSAVDRVAQAIWRKDPFKMGDPDNWTGDGDQAAYMDMARAAIDALDLTEEWGVITDMGVDSHRPLARDKALRVAEKYDDMFARSRLVSPWVRNDGGGE